MINERSQLFLTTRWTLLDKVKRSEASDALDQLCGTYWGPVYQFLRRLGCGEEDAEDLAQEFFRDFMARDGFGQAQREKGRFRNFLLRSARNHFANARKAAGRQKRGGGMEFVVVNDEIDSDEKLSPDEAFDKRWAEDLVDRALVKLRDEWESADRPFEMVMPYLSGDRGARPLAETAEALGVSLAATKSSVHRLRKRFGDLVREEVAKTVGMDGDAEEELQHLLQLLSRG